MTLDAVQINLERAFEPGMAYVALRYTSVTLHHLPFSIGYQIEVNSCFQPQGQLIPALILYPIYFLFLNWNEQFACLAKQGLEQLNHLANKHHFAMSTCLRFRSTAWHDHACLLKGIQTFPLNCVVKLQSCQVFGRASARRRNWSKGASSTSQGKSHQGHIYCSTVFMLG